MCKCAVWACDNVFFLLEMQQDCKSLCFFCFGRHISLISCGLGLVPCRQQKQTRRFAIDVLPWGRVREIWETARTHHTQENLGRMLFTTGKLHKRKTLSKPAESHVIAHRPCRVLSGDCRANDRTAGFRNELWPWFLRLLFVEYAV